MGVFMEDEWKGFDVILPGPSFAEKNGTIVNFQGVEQKLKAAIKPVGQSKPFVDVFAHWPLGSAPVSPQAQTQSSEAASV